MVMGIVLARLLTPEEFGDFAYVSATVGIIMLPLSITVNPLLITNVNNDNTLFGRVLGFTSIACALKLLVLSCYISFLILSERADEALLVFLIGAPIAIADLPETLKCDLEGRGRFAPNVVAQLANLSVHAAVSILLVLLGYGVYGLAAGGFVAYWPQLAVYLSMGRRHLRQGRFKWAELRLFFRAGGAFWTMHFSANMAARIDKIFLGKFGGDEQLGYYNRAINYAPLSIFLLSSLLTTASTVAIKQQASMRGKLRVVRRVSFLLFVGASANWVLLWWFADPIVPLLFGDQWRGAIGSFQALSWYGFAMALHYIPMNFLMANEAHWDVAIGKAVGLLSLAAALAVLWTVNRVNAVSVAYAFCIGAASGGLIMQCFSIPIVLKGLCRSHDG